jgi:hypothetical protein
MTSKIFKAQRFVYWDVHHVVEHMSLLNRSGICDGIICCNIVVVHTAVLKIKTAFNLVKIHLLFRIMLLIQRSVICCRPCCYRFWELKYIRHLFSEYMLKFMDGEPMKMCVTN